MFKNIYPARALIILVACGIAISYASQNQADYDPLWLGVCTLLFVAGCALAFNIMRGLPAPAIRIAMSRATWLRAKYRLGIGIACLLAAFGWLVWSPQAFGDGSWTQVVVILGPTLALGALGMLLIYHWLGLWAFGKVRDNAEE